MARDSGQLLGDLLAMIFGDGGHRRGEIGDDAVAVEEAIDVVCSLRKKADVVDRWGGTKFPVRFRLRDLIITIDRESFYSLVDARKIEVRGRGEVLVVPLKKQNRHFYIGDLVCDGDEKYRVTGVEWGGGSDDVGLVVRRVVGGS